MTTNSNLLTSPKGTVWFMALNTPVSNSKTGKEKREITVLLDSKEAAEFISAIADVNSGIPVTEHTYRGKDKNLKEALKGKTKISAGTQFEVPVYDSKGNKLEEIPMFFTGSKATAQIVVQPYTKSEKGGAINLVAVILHDIQQAEGSNNNNREAKLAELRAQIALATGE